MPPRQPRKMTAYPSFDAFMADQPAEQRAILRDLRALAREEAPHLEEAVKWGNGCWVSDEGPIAFAHCAPDHVQFGFFEGASLDDEGGLLEGNGKFVRHVKLRPGESPDRDALARLLKAAVAQGRS